VLLTRKNKEIVWHVTLAVPNFLNPPDAKSAGDFDVRQFAYNTCRKARYHGIDGGGHEYEKKCGFICSHAFVNRILKPALFHRLYRGTP